jgi:putative transcriptional regulator
VSDENTVVIEVDDDGSKWQIMPDGSRHQVFGATNWERLAKMTEEEIEANALSDPDNPPMTDEELARMMRVPQPKAIRERMGLSQHEFARRFHLSPQDVQKWEEGWPWPSWNDMLLLRIIDTHPEAVLDSFRQYGARDPEQSRDEEATPPATRRYRAAG